MNATNLLLPAALKARVEALMDLPLESTEDLAAEVTRHARVMEIVSKKRPVALPMALALSHGLRLLLDEVKPDQDDENRKLIQAACRYFIESEDGDHDLASESGLDDDAEVFVAVTRAVHRLELSDPVTAMLREKRKS